ncbi:DGQHR domain-containing protein DpdB [Herbaspirillum rhizosphaerae]|uniref:DGQHR domain-containing protein DpdB n=1 Tax=Herbaspirillum rhizosphaerae TaxID=346179 RepID=UPI00067B4E5B|nr:DGQHR domain-containing protein DpdB [Herbaspirillum rhizosphaerae]
MMIVSALKFKQGDTAIYCFAVPGNSLTKIADLSRVKRSNKDQLEGFQRKEIQQHVKQITDYLDKGPSLFPNAIILALAPQVRFVKSRGPKGEETVLGIDSGRLHLPAKEGAEKVAWIVDGQQRSLALAKSNHGELLVPVIAFESGSLDTQRQQFILVNRAKPLSQRLVNELLPETDDAFLPRDLAVNKIPSELCNLLHKDRKSPFFGRVNRTSAKLERADAINDSAIIQMIRDRINLPTGALTHFKGFSSSGADTNSMHKVLVAYWSAVAETFPEAWDLSPERSRLTHSVGIRAMGSLMDRMSSRISLKDKDLKAAFIRELKSISSLCAWTTGHWPLINAPWNSIEMTSRGLTQLSSVINTLYMQSELN